MMVNTGAYYIFIWLLFAGLIYGLLEQAGILGEQSVNAGVSLGSSFFILLGIFVFAPEGLFLNFAAALGFSMIGIFGLIILIALAGVDVSELGDGLSTNRVAGIGFLLVLISFIGAYLFTTDISGLFSNVDNVWRQVGFPIIFLIFLLLVLRTMSE
jgi:SNF family Na+-dependent transporter